MKIKPVLTLALATNILAGCSSMKVRSECDKEFDFNQIRTYQWISRPQEIVNDADTYINKDIRQALDAEFTGLGLQQVDDEATADVQVVYYLKLKEHQQYASVGIEKHEFSGGFTYSRKDRKWSYAEREPDLNAYVVETGTLTVLVYDAQTGERVWRGILQTEIDRNQSKDVQLERIRKAAKTLITRIPHRAD